MMTSHTTPRRRPRRRPHRRDRDDRGFTMLEVTIGMTIMSIFLGIFGSSMINMFRSVDRTQQTAYAQSAVNQIYVKLDRQIRFSSGLSSPATDASGNSIVEFANDTSGQTLCTQLQLTATGVLRQRSWIQPDDSSTTIAMGPVVILSADASPGTPTANEPDMVKAGPFAVLPAAGTASNQRLEVAVTARDTGKIAAGTNRIRHLDLTFTALNTGTSTSSSSVCSAGRGITWPTN